MLRILEAFLNSDLQTPALFSNRETKRELASIKGILCARHGTKNFFAPANLKKAGVNSDEKTEVQIVSNSPKLHH